MSEISRDHVIWAYRLLLDRDPEDESVVASKVGGYQNTRELRHDFMTSPEFADKNRDLAQTNERTVVIKPLSSGLRIFVDLADHAIGLHIVRDRFEEAELAFARRAARPGDVVIDAGAHVGLYTLHFAQAIGPAGHVYAFEPFPDNAALLSQSIVENGFEERVTLVRAAAGERSGSGRIAYATHTLNSGGAFLVPDSGPVPSGHTAMDVAIASLVLPHLRRPVSFVKLDVEGAELLALRGASSLLERDRPTLLCEVHYEQLARVSHATPEDLFAWLMRFGYGAYSITHDGRRGRKLSAPPTAPVSTIAFIAGDGLVS